MRRIYLDHSATTPLDPRVLDAMMPYFSDTYGNSMAVHQYGREAEHALETARETLAGLLNCAPGEIVFTSGGTESDNIALRGVAQHARLSGKPVTVITSPVEHEAISATARQLHDQFDAALRVVPVDHFGRVDPADLRAALQNLPAGGVTLVTLIDTNNEVGSRNPIPALAAVAHEFGALFHTDAVQAAGQFSLDVHEGIIRAAKIFTDAMEASLFGRLEQALPGSPYLISSIGSRFAQKLEMLTDPTLLQMAGDVCSLICGKMKAIDRGHES